MIDNGDSCQSQSDISEDVKQKLEWFDHYEKHGKTQGLPVAISASRQIPSIDGKDVMIHRTSHPLKTTKRTEDRKN